MSAEPVESVESTLGHLWAVQERIMSLQRRLETLIEAEKATLAALEAQGHRLPDPVPREHAEAAFARTSRHARKVLACLGWSVVYDVAGAPPQLRRRGGEPAHAVYLLKLAGEVVYIGRSRNVRVRVKDHRRDKTFDSVEVIPVDSAHAACDLEAVLLQQHRPRLNRRIEQRPVGVM